MRAELRTALGITLALPLLGAVAVSTHAVVLPTEWSLSQPPAQVAATGTLPQSARLTRDGKHLVVVEGGDAGSGISVLDPATLAEQAHVKLDGAFGDIALDATPDGYWVAGAGTDTLLHFAGAATAPDRTIALPAGFWASAVALSPNGKVLAASGDLVNKVALVNAADGTLLGTVKTGRHPNGLAFTRDGKKLYVANWGERSVTAIDVATRTVRKTIEVGLHPEKLLLSPNGKIVYVSETDDDTIGSIVVAADGESQPALSKMTPSSPSGVGLDLIGKSPTAMALSRDGTRLFVTCSAENAVEVYGISPIQYTPNLLGAIPTGWYPTAVTLDESGTGLYVANGMGEGSRANPQFDPFAHPPVWKGYDAASLIGSVRRIPIPSADAIVRGRETVLRLGGPFLSDAANVVGVLDEGPAGTQPGRGIVKWHGPIKHVIYVIKENRTYDQVLGDLPGGDGDPSLAYFGAKITPNEHALAQRFGIFDRTFADSVVSADGHNWSTAAFANDYLEKMWPANYGGRRKLYDFEDGADASVPHNGFIWDLANAAHLSLRDYGEFVTNPFRKGEDSSTQMPGLKGHIDPHYPGFDTTFRDEDREAEWAREFAGYVQRNDLPALELVRLPNDHTAGTRPGSRKPQSMAAENDLAVGRLVAAVSHSPYWKNTAIFIIEDDAQNGPDHVDDQRTTFYLISPYAKGGLQHAHYSTAGVLRTIELILGLPPMSPYDASALPLYAAFTDKPNFAPYDALPAQIDLEARNTLLSYRAADSAKMDFSRADAVPPAELNDILAHAR
jgi:YVTN family beta-propeller protein